MFEIYQDDKPEGVAELLPQSEEAMNSDIELAIAAYDKCWKKEEAMFENLLSCRRPMLRKCANIVTKFCQKLTLDRL